MSSNYQPNNRSLPQNNRFECLNNTESMCSDNRRQQDSHYSRRREGGDSQYSRREGGDSQYSRREGGDSQYSRRDRMARRSADKFSFLSNSERKPRRISIDQELNKGSFPTLGHIKKVTLRKKDQTDYCDMASKVEDDIPIKKVVTPPVKTGWCYLSRKNNVTIMHTIDSSGNKTLEGSHRKTPAEFNHEKFQNECAVASYSTLQNIQLARDDENETFGASSSHWGKSSLTDLSYLSDSDVESDESEQEYVNTEQYCSDDDTY